MIDAGDLYCVAPIAAREVVHLPDRQSFFKDFGFLERLLQRQIGGRTALIDRQSQQMVCHVSPTFSRPEYSA